MLDDRQPQFVGVETAEPCDWCGRPGRVVQLDVWEEDTLVCRNPALCPVCELIPEVEAGDAYEAYFHQLPGVDDALKAFQAELSAKWLDKVRSGQRAPQAPDERSGVQFGEIRFDDPT